MRSKSISRFWYVFFIEQTGWRYIVGNQVTHQYKKIDTTLKFDNAGFGAIGLGIISATYFILSGFLIKSNVDKN